MTSLLHLSAYNHKLLTRLRLRLFQISSNKQRDKEIISSRRKYALVTLLVGILSLAAGIGAYYHFVYLPKKQEEERIKSLMEYAGLTKEEAIEFDKNFKKYALYNQTLFDFAKFLKEYPLTTSEIFKLTKSFPITVSSLSNAKPVIVDDMKGKEFVLKYPDLVMDDGLNVTDVQLMKYHHNLPVLTDSVILSIPTQNLRLDILSALYPFVKNQTISEEKASSFITKHKDLALDDGLNATDIRLMKYYVHFPGVVDKVIEKIKSQEDRLFALNELTPYISKSLTEEQAYQLIEKWYPELFGACKKEKMPVVFGDPDEDFVNNYNEIFKYGTDPLFGIGNFTWTPTKVINSKVYEGSIFIRAKSLRGILPSKLYWVPINYTQFPLEVQLRAFPNETIREFDLIPVNENLIESTILIKDLKGGREYKAITPIRDKIGIENASLTTPYIREFENIAPLDDMIIIADYYTWYGGPPGLASWVDNLTTRHVYTPLLGEYDSGNSIVISRHIDWATAHGIDAFAVSWWSTGSDEMTHRHYMTKFFEKFLENPLIRDIKFCILYENNGRFKTLNSNDDPYNWIQDFNDPFNRRRLKEDFIFLTKYFDHPSCLKIDGKYYVRFDFTLPFRGDFEGAFKEMREELRRRGYEVYLGNDLMHRNLSPYTSIPFKPKDGNIFNEEFFRRIVTTFDFISGSGPGPASQNDLEKERLELSMALKEWKGYADKLGRRIIPVIWPGLELAPILAPKDFSPIKRMPARLENEMRISREYSNVLEIASFNEWGYGMQIEPSIEEGFIYLDVVKKQ